MRTCVATTWEYVGDGIDAGRSHFVGRKVEPRVVFERSAVPMERRLTSRSVPLLARNRTEALVPVPKQEALQ